MATLRITLGLAALSLLFLALSCAYGADEFHPVPLRAEIKGRLPMTGLVFWSTSEHRRSPAISMEFAYLRYDEVATARGRYDWSRVERLMSDAAARGHQLILHRAWKPGYNRTGGDFFGLDRWQRAPAGGEQLLDSADFARRIGGQWRTQASDFHISFMIADQWPRWMKADELAQHSAACGYRFQVERFEASESAARVMIANIGVAPIYYDAYPAVNGVRADESLAGLLPGQRRDFTIASGGTAPALTIESDRLIPGQRIGFESKLNP